MADLTIPNRPDGGDARSIAEILANFDAILAEINDGMTRGVVHAYLNLDTVVADLQQVPLDLIVEDTSSWFNTLTGVFVPLVGGFYRISWNVMSTGNYFSWQSYLRRNGTARAYGSQGGGSSGAASSSGSAIVRANGTTDEFDLAISHGGPPQTVAGGGLDFTYMCCDFIGRV